jgi:hypothetical protein
VLGLEYGYGGQRSMRTTLREEQATEEATRALRKREDNPNYKE